MTISQFAGRAGILAAALALLLAVPAAAQDKDPLIAKVNGTEIHQSDMAAAEDVVQEAFIRVHRAIESRSLHNPLAYLRQAVVNLARSELRRRLVRLRHAPRPMPDAPCG